MPEHTENINPSVPPSGEGCADCLATPDGWWVHLRRCAACGHVGCCDNSPSRHAALHFRRTGHPIIASFEPGDEWMYDYRSENYVKGQPLAPPRWHPDDQAIPGPEDRVPPDWESYLT
jgi:hypothetical protein